MSRDPGCRTHGRRRPGSTSAVGSLRPATARQPNGGSPGPSGCPRYLRAASRSSAANEAISARSQRMAYRSRRRSSGTVPVASAYSLSTDPPSLCEPPEIPLGWGDQNGVPVDDHPALRRRHHVSGMDLAVGDHHRTRIAQVLRDERSVAGHQPSDPGFVVEEQLGGNGCVRPLGYRHGPRTERRAGRSGRADRAREPRIHRLRAGGSTVSGTLCSAATISRTRVPVGLANVSSKEKLRPSMNG